MVSGVVDALGWFVIAMGQDRNTDYNDVWVMDFGINNIEEQEDGGTMTAPNIIPQWRQLRVAGTPPEVRYGGHGGIYPNTGFSFYVGFGFNKIDETGKRLGDMFRIAFNENSTINDTFV